MSVVDASIDSFNETHLANVDAIAVSVPMHTAKRLADQLTTEILDARPSMPVAHYGLYASTGAADQRVTALDGEYQPGLMSWVESLSDNGELVHDPLTRTEFLVPDRSGLPRLDRYARLETTTGSRLAGAVETSHGCRHRCRHCPLPVVYDGRIRVVPAQVVIDDIAQLVKSGAEHITFGDPDFFNAPAHSLAVLARAHELFPEVTYDVTIKVEHLIEHEPKIGILADMNVLFIVSAFESVDDWTLGVLDKGHTVADMERVVKAVADRGVYLRPTWLPFFPWTEPEDLAAVFEFIARHGLGGAVDPVQMAIRLLVPRGSLLLDHAGLLPYLDSYDEQALSWIWHFAHPETGRLFERLTQIAAEASDCGEEAASTLSKMALAVGDFAPMSIDVASLAADFVPRLSESWFCCAEPTEGQDSLIQIKTR